MNTLQDNIVVAATGGRYHPDRGMYSEHCDCTPDVPTTAIPSGTLADDLFDGAEEHLAAGGTFDLRCCGCGVLIARATNHGPVNV